MKPRLNLFLLFILFFNNISRGADLDTYSQQEIKYIAPKSATVFLVWKIEDYPTEEVIALNESTNLSDGLLYTPMVAQEDTFTVCLKLPYGCTFSYSFWITKNRRGQYEDFWDSKSGGKKTMTDTLPIIKNAVYWKKEDHKEIQLIKYGWLLLLMLLIPFLILAWAKKYGPLPVYNHSYELKTLMAGISLFFLHVLARASIIDIHPLSIRNDFMAWGKIIKASWSDFVYVGSLTTGFILLLWQLKNDAMKKWMYRLFATLVILSTLICLTNITTIVFLETPFTYQWLYYTDFLGSREALDAIQENLSIYMVLNLLALCTVVFLLAELLGEIIQFLARNARWRKVGYLVSGGFILVLLLQSMYVKTSWTKSEEDNPVTAFTISLFTSNSKPLIHSVNSQNDPSPFNPREAEQLTEPVYGVKDERVKNVLMIILESAGASYFDAYGGAYALSPNLNKYASRAIRFEQMYAHAPATNRSMVAILGSIYPYISYKSITQETPAINHPTITSVLKMHDYRTSFFSSADLSFQNSDEYLAYRDIDHLEDYVQIHCSRKFQLSSPDYKKGDGIDDLCLEDRFSAWVDEDTCRNFFSVLWTVQGHYPYYFENKEEDFGEPNYSFNRYLNILKHNDKLVGNVMLALEDRGLDSTTLVVVTGDHGEAFGQHGQYGHGTAIYEENLHVPLYFINPILFHGDVKDDIAGLKDLATTILGILDIDIPDLWQGRDLMQTRWNEAFYFAPWSDYLFGYRKDKMKYIFNETTGAVEVYDLRADKMEQNNLFSVTSKKEIEEARIRLGAWVSYHDGYMEGIFSDEAFADQTHSNDERNP